MVEVSLTVGKLDASLALLLTKDHHLIEFPTILLPDGIEAGSIVKIKCEQNKQLEDENTQIFEKVQKEIYETFGLNSPSSPSLKIRNITQTSAVLEWDPLKLATSTLISLTLYKNDVRLGQIPNSLVNTTTKLSGLPIDTQFTFYLRLETTAGVYLSEKVTLKTHKMTDLSGITACLGPVDDEEFTRSEIEDVLTKMGAKPLQDQVKVDTTHFIATTTKGIQWKKAVETNIPVVRPEWLIACESERRIVGVRAFYVGAEDSVQLTNYSKLAKQARESRRAAAQQVKPTPIAKDEENEPEPLKKETSEDVNTSKKAVPESFNDTTVAPVDTEAVSPKDEIADDPAETDAPLQINSHDETLSITLQQQISNVEEIEPDHEPQLTIKENEPIVEEIEPDHEPQLTIKENEPIVEKETTSPDLGVTTEDIIPNDIDLFTNDNIKVDPISLDIPHETSNLDESSDYTSKNLSSTAVDPIVTHDEIPNQKEFSDHETTDVGSTAVDKIAKHPDILNQVESSDFETIDLGSTVVDEVPDKVGSSDQGTINLSSTTVPINDNIDPIVTNQVPNHVKSFDETADLGSTAFEQIDNTSLIESTSPIEPVAIEEKKSLEIRENIDKEILEDVTVEDDENNKQKSEPENKETNKSNKPKKTKKRKGKK